MLGISTVWDHSSKEDMFRWLISVIDLGLHAIEIDYRVSREQIKSIELLKKDLGVEVVSLHNFCPVPNDSETSRHPSNHYRLTSIDEEERLLAVKWTKNTIDMAQRLNSSFVVVHAGTIDFEDERCSTLVDSFKQGRHHSPEYKIELDRILTAREEIKPQYMDALLKSFDEIVPYANEKNIKIGLETRYYPIEIPNFKEIGFLLERYYDKGMGYWHDVGHAEMNERLGIQNHLDFLDAYKDKMIGMHIHGIELARDHIAPFSGDMDFEKILPYLKYDIPIIIESKFATFEKIKSAVEKLKKL